MPDYSAPGAVHRLPGETFASFSARQKATQLTIFKPAKRKRRPSASRKTAARRSADRIDGFDRDDLGESVC